MSGNADHNLPALAAAPLQHWESVLAAYSYDIEFRPTGKHDIADGLSRFQPSSSSFRQLRKLTTLSARFFIS